MSLLKQEKAKRSANLAKALVQKMLRWESGGIWDTKAQLFVLDEEWGLFAHWEKIASLERLRLP